MEFDRVELSLFREIRYTLVLLLIYCQTVNVLCACLKPRLGGEQLGKVTATFLFLQEIINFLTKFNLSPTLRPSRGLFPESECKVTPFLFLHQIFYR